MESLLSGLIGALIATVLSVIYLYISEQSRLRSEVVLEVTAYFDDIYRRLVMLHTDKDAAYTGKKRGVTDEEYRVASRELKDQLLTSRVGVKLAITFGEGDITGAFNYLRDSCQKVTELLWSATECDWAEKNTQIQMLFSQHIDPGRKTLERSLFRTTRPCQIISTLFERCTKRRSTE